MANRARGRVIVVGSSNTDLVVHCDKLPGAGETVLGGDMLTFAGGKGANQAVAAARAGAKVYFIGAFGDDAFGKARRADLEREGIDCSGCVVKKGVPSGVALIAIGKSAKGHKAENLIVVAPGANARLTPADVKKGMPKDLDTKDVILISLEVPITTALFALKYGWQWKKSSGHAQTILNPAPMPAKGLTPRFFDFTHFVTPNETEFESIVGAGEGSNAAKNKVTRIIGTRMFPHFFVTRGAKGIASYDCHGYYASYVSAPKVIPKDTVGAGDCLNGSFAAQLSIDRSNLTHAIGFAVAAASLKVTRHGAQAGMPYRHEILKMMKKLPRS